MTYRFYVVCLSIIGILGFHTQVNGQTVDTTFSCNTLFSDSGGTASDYPANADQIRTFCPDSSALGFTKLRFYNLQLGLGDRLQIFDGPDTNATLLQTLVGSRNELPLTFQSSPFNSSRCLTVRFQSDAVNQDEGWEALVECIDSCQNIIARVDSTLPPTVNDFIDVCPGERIILFGNADFPENGLIYEHSNINSTYRWDFGDGSFSLGQNASHVYQEPGGYTIRLTVTDPFGCESTNIIERKVRVAPAPEFRFSQAQIGPVCIGDTVSLSSNLNTLNPNKTINVLPTEEQFSDILYEPTDAAIPDGTSTPLVSEILVSSFNSGQRLSNVSDLESICLNIEHSRVQDLDILIECPEGRQVQLHQNSGFTIDPVFLGEPFLGDEGRVIPGRGYDYCWIPNAPQGSWNDSIAVGGIGTLSPGNYSSENPLGNLVGCSLNGPWKLILRDTQVTANGYLFNWNLDFADELWPEPETFTTPLAIQQFEFDPSMAFYLADTIAPVAEEAGSNFLNIIAIDVNGCVYDTSIQMTILAETSPLCLDCADRYIPAPDTFICITDSIDLSIQSIIPNSQTLTFTSDPAYQLGFANHPPSNPYGAPLFVEGVAQESLTNPFTQIESICININSDFNEDLAIFLRAPNGQMLELSTNNGGGFDNYRNTCFSPLAPTPITLGSAPFAGNFSPEGNWSDLRGAPVNGVWELVVSDAFDPNSFGEIVDWEINFRSTMEFDVQWSPSEGLSCTDCPNPMASPAQTTTYSLSLTDSYGCTFQDEFTVSVLDTFAAPEIICGPLSPGKMIFNWLSIGEGLSYDATVRINGVDSVLADPIQDTFLIVDGLVFNDEVTLLLSVSPPDTLYPCFVGVGESSCIFEDCFTFTRFESITNVNCFGDSTGEVRIEALRGFRPFTYYLNDDFIGQADSVFSGLVAGDYQVVVEDATGCADTLFFSISQSEEIITQLELLDTLSCFGDQTARISANANGGTGELGFSWNYPLVDDPLLLTNLPSGNYVLSVEDSLGCIVQDSVFINQPDSIQINAQIDQISCAGDVNGGITVSLSGGTGQLSFNWSNGIQDTVLINLAPDTYTVTVSDVNACEKIDSFTLISPSPLSLDDVQYQSVSCFGRQNGEAEVFVSGGTAPYNYLWLDSLNQTNPRATNLAGGPIELRITDEQGCLLSEILEVPEPDSIIIDFSAKNVSCLNGADAQAIALVTGGTRPYTYNWQDGSTDSTLSNLFVGNYNITLTDANGCVQTNNIAITQPDTELLVSADQSLNGCFNMEENEAMVIAVGGGDSAYEYLWSDGQTTQTAVGLDSIQYSVTVTDANGCQRSTDIKLQDLPEMNPNTIISAPSCFGFSNGAIGINFIDGRPDANLDEYQFLWNTGQQGPTINNLLGDSLYTVSVTDPNGCMATESRFVRQPKLITFQLLIDNASCFGVQDGSVEVANISADSENFTYQWDERTGNQETALASNLFAGVYTVTISDEFGCSNVGQATVRQPQQIDIDFKQTDNTCFGDQTGAVSAVANGGVPEYRFAWSNGVLGADNTNLFSGNYTVTVTDQNNCFQEETVLVNQPAPIDVGVETQDVSCFGEQDGSIALQPNGGAPPYLFSLDLREFNGSPFLIGLGAGTYNVTIRDANNCSFVAGATVNEPPELIVDAGPSTQTIALGDSITLTAMAENGQGPVSFEWIEPFPGALPCLLCDSVTVSPGFTVSYELIGLDSVGCQANDFVQIFVEKEQIIDVPTGFSPNMDNENDLLILHGKPGTKINAFRVYDRLGELVHQAIAVDINDPEVGWDGKFNGEDMPQDTYIWYVQATFDNQVTKIFRGQTTLIR